MNQSRNACVLRLLDPNNFIIWRISSFSKCINTTGQLIIYFEFRHSYINMEKLCLENNKN